jgi:hypothetical protein
MCGVGQHSKVLDLIVVRIAIDVMHVLPRLKLSPKMLFHHIPMDSDLLSVYSHRLVGMLGFVDWLKPEMGKLFKVLFCQARPRAILCGVFPVRRHSKRHAAGYAR